MHRKFFITMWNFTLLGGKLWKISHFFFLFWRLPLLTGRWALCCGVECQGQHINDSGLWKSITANDSAVSCCVSINNKLIIFLGFGIRFACSQHPAEGSKQQVGGQEVRDRSRVQPPLQLHWKSQQLQQQRLARRQHSHHHPEVTSRPAHFVCWRTRNHRN